MIERRLPVAEGVRLQPNAIHRLPSRLRLVTAAVIAASSLMSIQALVPSALARQWYVDGDRPTNGVGTESDPFNTLNAVPASENDAVYVAGILRESVRWSGLRRGTVLQQWPGRRQTEIRGDVVVPAGEWTFTGDRVYATSIPSLPASVVWNWDSNVDSLDRHYGHLRSVSALVECRALSSSWYFDPVASTLYVHPPPGARPPNQGDEYAWVRTGNGFILSDGDGVTIDGLKIRLWSDPNPGSGYGLKIGDGLNSTVSNCTFEDCGFHSVGFVGTVCEGNRLVACVGRGLHSRSNHFVFYSLGADVVRCRAVDCEAHLYAILDWKGETLDPSDRVGGFYTHTGGDALVRDLEFIRCKAIGYAGAIGNSFGVGSTTPRVSEGRIVDSYPVRFVECVADRCDYANVEGSVAFIRCRLDFRKASQTGGNNGACLLFNRSDTQVALESCEIITRLDGTRAMRAVWAKNPDDVLYVLGSTFYDEFGSFANRSFIRASTSARITAEQTVFSAVRPLYLTNGSVDHTAENFDFHNCWYHGIGVGQYSSSPALDERSEWRALVDDSGWHGVSPEFVAPPVNLAPRVNGSLWRSRLPLEGVTRLGISGKSYDGRSGAHQFAWPIASVATSCPDSGPATISWTQATPRGSVALLYSRTLDSAPIPPTQPCAGLWLDLEAQSLVLIGVFESDGAGAGTLTAAAPQQACGGFLQLIDLRRCSTSNVAPVR